MDLAGCSRCRLCLFGREVWQQLSHASLGRQPVHPEGCWPSCGDAHATGRVAASRGTHPWATPHVSPSLHCSDLVGSDTPTQPDSTSAPDPPPIGRPEIRIDRPSIAGSGHMTRANHASPPARYSPRCSQANVGRRTAIAAGFVLLYAVILQVRWLRQHIPVTAVPRHRLPKPWVRAGLATCAFSP